MPYDIKPLSCEPKKLKGLSEKLIVSHWENNYGGAVKRLRIRSQLSWARWTSPPRQCSSSMASSAKSSLR